MEVSPEDLHELMLRPGPRAFRLVDVRTEDDFLLSRLDWAELIPAARIPSEARKRLVDADKPVVVYCRDGVTSEGVVEQLREMGFEFVFHLAGGLNAWVSKIDPAFLLDAPEPEAATPHASAPESAPSTESPGEVTPEDLRDLMRQPGPRDFRLVDVREEDEFHICRLEWAELIPLARLGEEAPRRLVDKDRPIVVYCHHGMRSQHACELLRHLGYEHVFNLTGGIDAWADRVEPGMRRY
ncbi:MAG: rhodanese-like domain-containing protein [Roseimicrobium sp.]